MRTITTAQRSQIAAGTLAIWTRLELQNPDLVWTDVSTALSTPDWFNEATLTESIDQASQSFTAALLRDTGSLSLSPLRTDSTINRNAALAYAPMLDVKRQWRVSIAVVATGTTPVTADWKPVGQGFIDKIDVQGSPSTITVTGRDMLARILDHYMHGIDGVQLFPPYSPSGTDSMETVIQQILDDELGTGRTNVGSSGITLYTPVSPSYVIPEPYTTGVGSLMDLLTSTAQKAGMVIRYVYDASDVLRLTLLKPPRTATTADWTIGKDEYSVMPVNDLDVTGVRTVIDLFYIDPSTGQQHVTSPAALTGTLAATAGAATFSVSQAGVIANGSLILVDGKKCTVSAFNGTTGCTLSGTPTFAASPWTTSASLTKYGELYMKVDLSGSLPMTAANAQAMADAIRSDLETPWLEQQFTSYALWFAQLYDYAKTLANGVQYNTDQLGGVTTITHRMKGGTVKTDIGARGQPAGGYRSWLRYGLVPIAAQNLVVSTVANGDGTYTVTWSGQGVLLSIDNAAAAVPSASPFSVTQDLYDHQYVFTGVVSGRAVTYVIGIPAVFKVGPELNYAIDASGNVSIGVIARRGTDRTWIAVRADRKPTVSEILAGQELGPAIGSGNLTYTSNILPTAVPQVAAHSHFWIGAISMTSNGTQSDPAYLAGQWLGIGVTPLPTVTLGLPVPTGSSATIPITLGPTTRRVDFFIVEAPEASPLGTTYVVGGNTFINPVDVEDLAPGVYDWIERASDGSYPSAMTFPIFKGLDILYVTAVPIDALGQRGDSANTLTQAAATATTPPNALTLATPSATSTTLSSVATIPASGTAVSRVRVFLDGAFYADVTAVGAGLTQTLTVSGLPPSTSHTISAACLASDGTPSTTTSAAPTNTSAATLVAPTGLTTSWSGSDQAVEIFFTPGASDPAGTEYHVFRATTSGGIYTDIGNPASASPALSPETQLASGAFTIYYKLQAVYPGGAFASSAQTAFVSCVIPSGKS